jgi:hypothetical protein
VCSPVDGVMEEDEFAFVHPLVFLQQRRRKARVSIIYKFYLSLLGVLILAATLFAAARVNEQAASGDESTLEHSECVRTSSGLVPIFLFSVPGIF